MSDATAFTPVVQSASQLSENIGDVLASIRRLIAQDEAAEAGSAAPLRAAAPSGRPVEWSEPAPASESLSRRRDILAEAQALTRRSEAAFGRAPDAVPLTLGPAERVASFSSPLPAPVISAVAPGVTAEGGGTLVLTEPLPLAAAPAASRDATGSMAAAAVADADALIQQPLPSSMPGAAATGGKADDMIASDTPTAAFFAQPAAPVIATMVLPGTTAEMPLPSAAPVPSGASTMPQTVAVTPANPAPPPAAVVTGPLPASNAAPGPAPASAPLPEDEDCTASILREMIRDVVRQELTGDPAGRMTGNLRSMIMREVAQVLTQGARGAR